MFGAFYYKKTAICFCYGIPFFESHGGENTFFVCWQQNGAALKFISQKEAFLLKTFFFSISLNLNFTRNKKKHVFCAIKLSKTYLSNEKEKVVSCDLNFKTAQFRCKQTTTCFR